MVALSDVRGPVGGLGVGRGGGGSVAAELVQIRAHGMPAVPFADRRTQPVRLAQPGGDAEHMADRDRAAKHRGRILAHGVRRQREEVVVPREDLWPVGLLGARRVVVQGSDRSLELVAARGRSSVCMASADCSTRTPSAVQGAGP